jgi:hypothetical protein
VPKPPTCVHLPTLLGGCRIVGGINEQAVIAVFAESRQRFAEGKGEQSNDDDDIQLRHPAKRLNYTQEKKLQAILYSEETYMPPTADREPGKLISGYLAAKTIKITTKMLQDWQRNRLKILSQKKGSKRAQGAAIGCQPELGHRLHDSFVAAQKAGRIVGLQWFLKNA